MFPLVRLLWRPVLVLVAVLVWLSQFLVLGLGVVGWVLLGVGACHSWLRAWLVLCVLAVFLAAMQLPWRGVAGFLFFGFSCVACVCGAGGARALVCGVRLWGSCRWLLWQCVLCACAGVCAVCWWSVWVPVLGFLGLVWRLCVGVGAVCRGPSPVSGVGSGCGSPPPLAGVCWWCVPPPTPLRALPPLSLCRVAWGGVPLVPWPGLSGCGGLGGGHCCRLGSLPLVFPLRGADACTPRQGITLLYGPSICTRSVQMDLLRSQVLQPFPTPGSGTLWVVGESLRDRRVSCLPRWTVCRTCSPSLGPNRSTCRRECSWSRPLVTPQGRCHRGSLTNSPGRIPPYCVCSGGANTVTRWVPKPLRLGPSPASPVGPFRPAPLFAVWFAVVGFPSLPGGVVVVGGALRFSWPCCLCACPHLPWLWFPAGVCVCGAVRARVVSVLVCVSCVRGGVGVGVSSVCVGVCVCVYRCVAGAGWGLLLLWVWVWLVCAVVGPSPLLTEVPDCDFPPRLAGFRCQQWWVLLATPVWGPLAAVVCCRLPLLAAGPGPGSPPLLARGSAGGGVGWAPATPGCGSRGQLPATPGWGPPAAAVGASAGGGVPCCVCLWRGVCMWCLCWCVWCGVCSWCLCWWWCGRGRAFC